MYGQKCIKCGTDNFEEPDIYECEKERIIGRFTDVLMNVKSEREGGGWCCSKPKLLIQKTNKEREEVR